MTIDAPDQNPLLLPDIDPLPVSESRAEGRSAFLLTCDHYGRRLPRRLGDLGLPDSELGRHIAWDIGMSGVAEHLAELCDAHLIAQRYSRLVIDCNRRPGAPTSIPRLSERTIIPGNDALSTEQALRRRLEIFDPYHQRIAAAIDARQRQGRATVLLSLHSFTPVYAGVARPWHVGTLYNRDIVLAPRLLRELHAQGDLVVGDNEPYAVSDLDDYTIPVHGEARGLINCGIEIRQDLIADPAGQRQWAERLARMLATIETTLRDEGLI